MNLKILIFLMGAFICFQSFQINRYKKQIVEYEQGIGQIGAAVKHLRDYVDDRYLHNRDTTGTTWTFYGNKVSYDTIPGGYRLGGDHHGETK